MEDQNRVMAYPLRMSADVRAAATALAEQNERSLNWQLNDLLKAALQLKETANAQH